MRSIEALRESTDPRWIRVAGMVRRMAITLTTKVLWQLKGVRMPDGSHEVVNAEPFTGFGFFSRPPSSGEPEAIVTSLGDASASVIVAVRDEKTRAAVVGDLKVGETAMYNAKAVVYAKDDGTIEARSVDGAATELSTKADLATLKDAITNATVVAQDGGASFKSTLLLALKDWPAGTKTFKAE